MKKTFFLILILLSFSVSARPYKFNRIDKNKDGVIDKKEWKTSQIKRHKIRSWWKKRADTNNDGIVDKNELEAFKKLLKERMDLNNDGVISPKERRLCFRHARSKVNTPLEERYDVNKDGWLDPEETKKLLSDRLTLIKTEGKAKVESAIEKEYDENKDGIISKEEAENIIEEELED